MSNTHSTVFVVDDDRSGREVLVDLISPVGMKAEHAAPSNERLAVRSNL